jgi:hypothetical protein
MLLLVRDNGFQFSIENLLFNFFLNIIYPLQTKVVTFLTSLDIYIQIVCITQDAQPTVPKTPLFKITFI